MALRAVITLQIGADTIVLGPPSAFGGLPDGNQIGRPGLHGREDARRWVERLCQEPAARNRIRQQIIHWTGDPHHVNRIPDAQLANTLVDLCARGRLAMWASRPLGGSDAKLLGKNDLYALTEGPVQNWSLVGRIAWVLQAAADELNGISQHNYLQVTNPDAVRMATGVITLWAGSLTHGTGDIMDVVLQIAQSHRLHRSAHDVTRSLAGLIKDICAAQDESDLTEAAHDLAVFVTLVGVAQFLAMLLVTSRKAARGAIKPKRTSLRGER